jgi:hypothetical protein
MQGQDLLVPFGAFAKRDSPEGAKHEVYAHANAVQEHLSRSSKNRHHLSKGKRQACRRLASTARFYRKSLATAAPLPVYFAPRIAPDSNWPVSH